MLLAGLLLLAASACEDEPLEEISLTSIAFHHRGTIPARNGCYGEDLSVPLSFSEGPEGTVSFAVTMIEEISEDNVVVEEIPHWVVWGIAPNERHLGEGEERIFEPRDGVFQGLSHDGEHGYAPPCPDGGKRDKYVFTVWALEEEISLGADAGLDSLEAAMKGKAIGKGELVGYYEKP